MNLSTQVKGSEGGAQERGGGKAEKIIWDWLSFESSSTRARGTRGATACSGTWANSWKKRRPLYYEQTPEEGGIRRAVQMLFQAGAAHFNTKGSAKKAEGRYWGGEGRKKNIQH